MSKRVATMIAIALLAGQAEASPLSVIESVLTKIFKGGAAKEAAIAGKAEGYAATKGIEHLPTGDTALKTSALSQSVEPKPNMATEPVSQNGKDAVKYKALRTAAEKGDTTAMLRMSELTSTGRVSDPGEPWFGYWMFQAARLGSQAAVKQTRSECVSREDRRVTDRWFDRACSSADGQVLYKEEKISAPHPALRNDFIYRPTELRSKP